MTLAEIDWSGWLCAVVAVVLLSHLGGGVTAGIGLAAIRRRRRR